MVVNGGEYNYIWRRGGLWGMGERFNDYNTLKGLRSVPNVICSCPLKDILVYFVIIIINH